MAKAEDLEFEVQPLEGFFNELEDDIKAKITSDGVYKLTQSKEDPALFTDAEKVTDVPDGIYIEDGRLTLPQDEADYIFVKFSV